MTNAMIVYMESQKLAEDGIIKYTGRELKMLDAEGVEIIVKETEPIHTYAVWKKLGYQVKKGEKAIAQFPVWKRTTKMKEVDNNGEKEMTEVAQMFLKTASFFSSSQVEKVEKEKKSE